MGHFIERIKGFNRKIENYFVKQKLSHNLRKPNLHVSTLLSLHFFSSPKTPVPFFFFYIKLNSIFFLILKLKNSVSQLIIKPQQPFLYGTSNLVPCLVTKIFSVPFFSKQLKKKCFYSSLSLHRSQFVLVYTLHYKKVCPLCT